MIKQIVQLSFKNNDTSIRPKRIIRELLDFEKQQLNPQTSKQKSYLFSSSVLCFFDDANPQI